MREAENACSGMGKCFFDYLEPIDTQSEVFQPTKATLLTELDGSSFIDAAQNYVLVEHTDGNRMVTYTVYDYIAEKTVFEIEDMAAKPDHITVKLHQVGETGHATVLYSVTVQDQYQALTTVTTLYRADNGEEIASGNEESNFLVLSEDLFTFDNVLYRAANGKIEIVKDYVNGVAFSRKYRSHYYYFTESLLSVYDENLDFVSGYHFPSYLKVDPEQIFILSDGNVVFQGSMMLPKDATDYHYLDDGEKYRISTYLFDRKSGDVEELEFPYLIGEMGDSSVIREESDLSTALLYPLVNHTADINHLQIVLVNGKLDIEYSINDLVKDAREIVELDEDRICVFDAYGNVHYLKWDGTTVKITGAYHDIATSVVGYYYVNDVEIYDRDFNLLVNYEESGYSTVAVIGKSVLMKKVVDGNAEYALFVNGEKKVVATASTDAESYLSANTEVNLYCMIGENEDGEKVCKYYNADGDLIMTSSKWTIEEVFTCRTKTSRLILLDGHFIRLDQ